MTYRQRAAPGRAHSGPAARWRTLLAAYRFTLFALAIAASPLAHAMPAVTTVTVKDRAGAPVVDTIVVFDPLDAMPPAAQNSAVIDQIDKKFVPRVSVMRTGTAVTFPNSDRIRHQVYSFSEAKVFNIKLYAGAPQEKVVFDKAGLVVLGCNIHDGMVAFVGVVDSPYFAKTAALGSASVNLPPGHYRLRVWHPSLAVPVPPITVEIGSGSSTIPVTVVIDAAAAGVAAWVD